MTFRISFRHSTFHSTFYAPPQTLTDSSTETALCMGGDVKAKNLGWQMWNTYQHIAKLQLAALEHG